MSTRMPKLTHRQRAAIPLLVAGRGPVAVAEAVGVNRRQVTRWLADPDFRDFREALDRARKEAWGAMLDRIRGLLPSALDVLGEELKGEARARAALDLVKLAFGKTALDPSAGDLEARLTALEAALLPGAASTGGKTVVRIVREDDWRGGGDGPRGGNGR